MVGGGRRSASCDAISHGVNIAAKPLILLSIMNGRSSVEAMCAQLYAQRCDALGRQALAKPLILQQKPF